MGSLIRAVYDLTGPGQVVAAAPFTVQQVTPFAAFFKGDPATGGGGVSDHGGLDGLGDDDHPHYLTEGRGDARYSPLVHGHVIGDVAGLQAALDGKQPAGSYAASSHSHALGDVSGLVAALAAKSDAGHVHVIAQVTGLQAALDSKAASAHGHAIVEVTGLQAALDGKQPAGSYAAAAHTHPAADIADSSAAGRALLAAPDAAAQTALLATVTSGAKGLAPASGGGTANFLRADGTWAPPGGSSDPLDLADDTPGTPAAGTVRLFRRSVSGRAMPAFIGPSGLDTALQPFIARNKIAWFQPTGNGTGVSNIGIPSASQGTVTTRSVSVGTFFGRIRRIGYRSAATAGSMAEWRSSALQYTLGDGAGLGGFMLVVRLGLSEVVAGMRAFVGTYNQTSAASNVNPATLLNAVGMARIDGSSNWHIVYGGSTAQAPIDLGANFPADTANTDFYELALFAPSTVAETVHWEVTRLNTGHVASGTLTGNATVLPSSGNALALPRIWVTNNATAAACAFDIASVYIETDQ